MLFNAAHLNPGSAESNSAFRSALGVCGFHVEGTGGGNSAAVRRYYRENGDLWFSAYLTDGDMGAPCFGACELSVFAAGADGEEGNIDEYMPEGAEVDFVLSNLRAAFVPVVAAASVCYEVHTFDGTTHCVLKFSNVVEASGWASRWVGVDPLARFAVVEFNYSRLVSFGNESVC